MSVRHGTGHFRVAVAAESLTPFHPPLEALRWIARLGCADVQLCASLFPSRVHFSVREAWELRRQLDVCGLRAESMSTFPHRMEAAMYVDFLRRVVHVAPTLGVRVMNVYLFPFLAQADEAAAVAHFGREIRALADEAVACGLVFCLEPEAFDRTRNVQGLLGVLNEVGHERVQLTYDPCNLYQGGEEAFPYAYEALRGHIAHVHLKNGSVFVDGRDPPDEKAFAFAAPFADRILRWGPLEEGAINIHGLLDRLCQDKYEGVVVLEPHTRSAEKQHRFLSREVALVRRWLSMP